MRNTVQLQYNKGFAYISGTCLFTLFLLLLFQTFRLNDIESEKILSYFDIGLFAMLIYFVSKYFIPALTGQIALELNQNVIVDNVNKRTIDWNNVQNIRQVNFGNSSGIAIDLIDKEEFMQDKTILQKIRAGYCNLFYNTPLLIALQYVAGTDSEILQVMQNYYEQRKNCT